jgi:hypothetical protein
MKFEQAFEQLRGLLAPHADQLVITKDEPGGYSLDAPFQGKYGKTVFFGAAIIKKNYVSYYLMPLYVCPDLLAGLSPALKKRMQGKSCFNFTGSLAPEVLAELEDLTARGLSRFKEEGLV